MKQPNLKLIQAAENETLIFYGATEVADFLGVSVPVARGVMKSKGFPLLRIGKKLKVSKKALKDWAMCKQMEK